MAGEEESAQVCMLGLVRRVRRAVVAVVGMRNMFGGGIVLQAVPILLLLLKSGKFVLLQFVGSGCHSNTVS